MSTERVNTGEYFTIEQASAHAAEFCRKHPAWIRVCDMPDTEEVNRALYVHWDELSKRAQDYWGSEYAYNEFATKRCKVKQGVMTGKGELYDSIIQAPLFHNVMCMYRVGVSRAREWSAQRAKEREEERAKWSK
ncbi:hypothetical protein LA345_38890 (plasmid) [Burkholderia vietnamiensis]|uniref:Uncharacterized protein n=1 Tax=Burkholderia vietnamiensis (strain G4 / LMG 22486) TaxID=269482 RepID=A4JWD8_BURVG|nr:hypothetical protein Bcep1808_7721 [Burkholderia vietnamiensis G4]MCB4349766.1 hypothetical protein [Burkholderia vietnamiensis]